MKPDKVKKPLPPILCIIIIAVITAVAFFPSLWNDFVNWDDPYYVTQNENIKSLSLENLAGIFSSGCEGETSFEGAYCPLVILSYALEYRFFKLDPFIYHLTNYLLHIIVSILVFLFLRMLSKNVNVAFIAAMLFSIHPLRVESVAWITERKDLFYAAFYMLSLMAYAGYIRSGRRKFYVLCLAAWILSLFSKAMAVTLPLILLLMDYFYYRKPDKRSVLEKAPFFAIAAIFASINLYFHRFSGADRFMGDLSSRLYFLLKGIPFYLSKIFFPAELSAMYPYYRVGARHMAEAVFYAAVLALCAALIYISKRFTRKVVFGSAFFVLTALPILQIVPAGGAYAADRYTYLPSLGIVYILAESVNRILTDKRFNFKALRIGVISFVGLAVISLSVLTWNRCGVWRDSETLFSDTIEKHDNAPEPLNNLGVYFEDKEFAEKALYFYKRALLVRPDYVLARENFERLYAETAGAGSGAEAFAQKEDDTGVSSEVIWLNLRGIKEFKSGDAESAVSMFENAAQLDPAYPESFNNLGFALYRMGELKRAEACFKRVLEIDPEHKKARMNIEFIQKTERDRKSSHQ
ncbi:tetratricopeptide repeat protein [Candidatus Omnitrophota bacterium]